MTDYASLAGARVMSARLMIPAYGAWVADVVLASSTPIPAVASPLVLGDLTLLGTAFRMASFAGSRSARLAGGFGGWSNPVPAQSYVGSNVRMSTVLRDAATAVGEKILVDVVDANLSRFTREAGPASRVLQQLAGPTWYVAPDGVTHVGQRPADMITSDFTVDGWSGATGALTIATEVLADWFPGRTFTAPTVSGIQTVGYMEAIMMNDGRLRIKVLAS